MLAALAPVLKASATLAGARSARCVQRPNIRLTLIGGQAAGAVLAANF